MALELLKILDERKRGRASAGCITPSSGGCDSLHQEQQSPSDLKAPQESAPAGWTSIDDWTTSGIMWYLCAESSPCTEAGELQGLLASSFSTACNTSYAGHRFRICEALFKQGMSCIACACVHMSPCPLILCCTEL